MSSPGTSSDGPSGPSLMTIRRLSRPSQKLQPPVVAASSMAGATAGAISI